MIHLFGTDENGISLRCDVTGFRPTLYIRLPETKTSSAVDTIKQIKAIEPTFNKVMDLDDYMDYLEELQNKK